VNNFNHYLHLRPDE